MSIITFLEYYYMPGLLKDFLCVIALVIVGIVLIGYKLINCFKKEIK